MSILPNRMKTTTPQWFGIFESCLFALEDTIQYQLSISNIKHKFIWTPQDRLAAEKQQPCYLWWHRCCILARNPILPLLSMWLLKYAKLLVQRVTLTVLFSGWILHWIINGNQTKANCFALSRSIINIWVTPLLTPSRVRPKLPSLQLASPASFWLHLSILSSLSWEYTHLTVTKSPCISLGLPLHCSSDNFVFVLLLRSHVYFELIPFGSWLLALTCLGLCSILLETDWSWAPAAYPGVTQVWDRFSEVHFPYMSFVLSAWDSCLTRTVCSPWHCMPESWIS